MPLQAIQAASEARATDGWVYVVDDDLSMREALSSLARSRGFRVKTFDSARAFLAHPRSQGPSCLILDICLPGLTGPELHGELERTRNTIPTIYLTGNGDVPTAVRAMKAGAVEFLTKPFEHKALLAAIQQCLAQWQRARPDQLPAAPAVLEFEPFRLDVREQCLWRYGYGHRERIALSPKAFTVLRYLVERPGRLVTENELLRVGWPKVYVQPEAVKHRLYEIRKALRDSPKAPRFIETFPRRGYRFIASIRDAPATADPPILHEAVNNSLPGQGPALALLRERLRLASRGQRQLVFVEGDFGMGKTALVEEFQRLAAIESPGLRIAYSHCIEGCDGMETYYPVLEALESLCRQSSHIVDVVETHAPTWLVQFPALLTDDRRRKLQQEILGATRERMLREIAQALETVSFDQPLLLILEDLQWADGPTLNLISALARRRTPAQLMLVATSRALDAPVNGNPLQLLTNDLLARGLCRRVELEPLTSGDITAYLAAEPPPYASRERFAQFLHRMSGGNPLFLRAALDYLAERQLVSPTSRGWELKAPLPEEDPPVPPAVRIVIESQLQRLAPEERRALAAASLVGSMFTVAEAAGLCGDGSDLQALEPVFEGLARGTRILRRARTQPFKDGAPCYEFTNVLYRKVLHGSRAMN